ncbi:hypothetical protein GCM10020255_013830 [Rhodococcus baikonurensis]
MTISIRPKFSSRLDRPLATRHSRYVTGICNGNTAGVDNFLRDCLGRIRVRAGSFNCAAEVVHHDLGTEFAKQMSVSATDAATGTCHDRDAAVESVFLHCQCLLLVADSREKARVLRFQDFAHHLAQLRPTTGVQ